MNNAQYTSLINGFFELEDRLDHQTRTDDSVQITGQDLRLALAQVVHEIGRVLQEVFLELDDQGTKRSSDTDTAF